MHSDGITLQRLERALRDRLRPRLNQVVEVPVEVAAWTVGGEPVPFATAVAAPFEPISIGDHWGRAWDTTWFRLRTTVPAAAIAASGLELLVDLGWRDEQPGFQAEGLAYRPDGRVIKGIEPLNAWIPVEPSPDGEVEVFIEAAANPQFFGHSIPQFSPSTLGDVLTAGPEPLYRLAAASLVVRDAELASLLADLELVAGIATEESVDPARRAVAVRALDQLLDRLDGDELSAASAGQIDVDGLRSDLAGVLSSPAASSAHRVSAVGHAHIDSAWLWPLREARRKVARTVANVLQLMDEDDDLVHVMSAAQHWDWLREDHPALFERAVQRAREGRFVPVGGMWVESDAVMPGGEAMARQFVEGQRFFVEHVGEISRVAWLPDSFGYSGALPQIVRQAGIEYFLTQKISWNRVNRFPHHTFSWIGIDGTSVFTHFPPADTYNGTLTPAELTYTAGNFREKGAASRSLIPFGFGDGGGGPTREMLARAARTADVEGLPRVRIERPEVFFEAAEAEYPQPPEWFGELYLELHRGTLSSQAAMKRGNRRSEHLLREAELWSASASVSAGAEYPYEALRLAWRTVLLHQFHDILPGSSIGWVHRQARETYRELAATLTTVIDEAQAALTGPGDREIVFNAGPLVNDGVPAGGAALTSSEAADLAPRAERRGDGGVVLTVGHTVVTVAADGTITSIVDVATGTEAVAPAGQAGLLQLHPDHPVQWDAWDVDRHYRNAVHDVREISSLDVVEASDAVTVTVVRQFGASSVRQTIRLHGAVPGVELVAEVDWHEREKLLKLAFDVDVHAERARFETQFGHIARAIHDNTSWDAARFEVAAHRWVQLGEPVGVALASDATYAYEVRRTAREGGGMAASLRATLLRSPRFPDPETDQGEHRFGFWLVPAATPADAVAAGYRLNLPLRHRVGGTAPAPLVTLDGDPNLLIETVRLADDGSGDVVVRLYEAHGIPGRARLTASFAASGFTRTNLLEDPIDEQSQDCELTLRPFQIATVRITRAS